MIDAVRRREDPSPSVSLLVKTPRLSSMPHRSEGQSSVSMGSSKYSLSYFLVRIPSRSQDNATVASTPITIRVEISDYGKRDFQRFRNFA